MAWRSRFRPRTTTWLAALVLLLGSCRDLTGVDLEKLRLVFLSDLSYDTLYVASPEDGTIEQRIALPVVTQRIQLSPSGDRVAVIHGGDLSVMNLDGSGELPLAADATNATWSPDGMRLAYVRGSELRIVGANGGGDVAVPGAQPGGWYGIAWSPDGGRIAFEGMRDGARTIYVVNPDGTALRDIDLSLTGPAIRSSGEPTWSPDGRKLAFSRWVLNDLAIPETGLWVATLATGRARRITTAGSLSDVRPTWSPDGGHIAFLRFDGDRSEVFIVRHDGTGLRQITYTPAIREEEPHWMRR